MEYVSSVLGFAGWIIAVLSFWLNYKGRSSSHRELIYQKQVEAFSSILNELDYVHEKCISFIFEKGIKLNDKTRVELRSIYFKVSQKLNYESRKQTLFLPASIQNEMLNYRKVILAISAPPSVADQYPPNVVHSEDPAKNLAEAYSRIISKMRLSLGVEPLSKEIMKLVGGSERKDLEKEKG